jgi:hypothetical protein
VQLSAIMYLIHKFEKVDLQKKLQISLSAPSFNVSALNFEIADVPADVPAYS